MLSVLASLKMVKIISLTASKLPIALGIAGCIVLTGTDISAGRAVGLTACVAASLLQIAGYPNKMYPELGVMPLWAVFLIVIAIGAVIGFVNGFFVAKFKLHPFIVTLSTQLIIFGTILMYLMTGTNNGQTLSGLDSSYTDFIRGTLFSLEGVAVPRYVLYSLIITEDSSPVQSHFSLVKSSRVGYDRRESGRLPRSAPFGSCGLSPHPYFDFSKGDLYVQR